jgi:hypothetical protein
LTVTTALSGNGAGRQEQQRSDYTRKNYYCAKQVGSFHHFNPLLDLLEASRFGWLDRIWQSIRHVPPGS